MSVVKHEEAVRIIRAFFTSGHPIVATKTELPSSLVTRDALIATLAMFHNEIAELRNLLEPTPSPEVFTDKNQPDETVDNVRTNLTMTTLSTMMT